MVSWYMQFHGVWLPLSSVPWGIWPKMTPARWGIWLSSQNVCQLSETKGLCFYIANHNKSLSLKLQLIQILIQTVANCLLQDMWWQGWPSGESTCLPPMWPEFDIRTRCHMWIEFVGSLLCYERFSPGYSGFPLSSKTNIWFDLSCE